MQQTATSSDSGAPRRTVRDTLRRAAGRLRRGRADERGLTTLEWLLIVAAVAGLAALAVVLVQNVVDETAEDIGGQSARGTAARVAAERITREARADLPTPTELAEVSMTTTLIKKQAYIKKQQDVNTQYGAACDRLKINYGDIDDFDAKWYAAEVADLSPGTDRIAAASRGTTSTEIEAVTSPLTDPKFEAADAAAEVNWEARCTVNIPS